MAEKYYSVSPYVYCANNPMRFIDLTGMWYDEANEKEAKGLEKKIDKKIRKLERQVVKLEKKGKDIGDRKERISELNKSKSDISNMRGNKAVEFRFAKASDKNNPAGKGNPTIDGLGTGVVTMYSNSDDTKIHEARHGGDVARGILNKENYGVADEVSAYRAQYSYSGSYSYLPANALDNPVTLQIWELMGIGGISAVTVTNIDLIDATFVNNIGEQSAFIDKDRTVRYRPKAIYPPKGVSKEHWIKN